MITVSRRAHRTEDRAGDPLDGLVNLFDVGIVLAVGFLLAALASLHLTGAVTRNGLTHPTKDTITVSPGQVVSPVPTSGAQTAGRGTEIGKVYRLRDGRLVYVIPSSATGGNGAAPTAPTVPNSPAPSTTP